MDARARLLLEGPVSSTILRLSLPNVIVMVVQTSIGLIETYFVAKLGLDALAGIALVFPLFMLLQMVSAGGGGGGGLCCLAPACGWCSPSSCCCRWYRRARWAAAFCQPLRGSWARLSVIVPMNWSGPPS